MWRKRSWETICMELPSVDRTLQTCLLSGFLRSLPQYSCVQTVIHRSLNGRTKGRGKKWLAACVVRDMVNELCTTWRWVTRWSWRSIPTLVTLWFCDCRWAGHAQHLMGAVNWGGIWNAKHRASAQWDLDELESQMDRSNGVCTSVAEWPHVSLQSALRLLQDTARRWPIQSSLFLCCFYTLLWIEIE